MEISVNGTARTFDPHPTNVKDLLGKLGIDPGLNGIAVALNLSVVPRSQWEHTSISQGDEIEVITARQGG